MKKSITNLFRLHESFCFRLENGKLTAISADGKSPEGVLMGQLPRVHMTGTRVGDEKSNVFKNMKAVFSWFVFPLTVFYLDGDRVNVNMTEYEITNPEEAAKNSTLIWE